MKAQRLHLVTSGYHSLKEEQLKLVVIASLFFPQAKGYVSAWLPSPSIWVSPPLRVHRLYSVHGQDNIVLLVNHISDPGRKAIHRFSSYKDINIKSKLIITS